jgi:hypothetical protein
MQPAVARRSTPNDKSGKNGIRLLGLMGPISGLMVIHRFEGVDPLRDLPTRPASASPPAC